MNYLVEQVPDYQNYPNPFTESTTIRITVPNAGDLKVDIFSLEGKCMNRIYAGKILAGVTELNWNANNMVSGIYICRIEFGGNQTYLKIVKQ